jgi:hypothetical protein
MLPILHDITILIILGVTLLFTEKVITESRNGESECSNTKQK